MGDWADEEARKILADGRNYIPKIIPSIAAALRKAKAAGVREAAELAHPMLRSMMSRSQFYNEAIALASRIEKGQS